MFHKHLEVAGSFHFLESESAPVLEGGSPQPVGWHTMCGPTTVASTPPANSGFYSRTFAVSVMIRSMSYDSS